MIYGLPAENADLYYALGATVTDPMFIFNIGGKLFAIAQSTEIDVLKRKSKIKRILPYAEWFRKAKSKFRQPDNADVCTTFLKSKKIKHVQVHPHTPVFITDKLRKNGLRLEVGPLPFFPKRIVKTPTEINHMRDAQNMTFKAMRLVETILRKSRIVGNKLIYRGKALTSEFLHTEVKTFLLQHNYQTPVDLIVSCGNAATEPHNRGSGLLRPHQSIIVDIFPQNNVTYMYGDATRTFCKGKPSAALHRMYLAVKEAQEMGIRMIKPGVNGQVIHKAIHSFFSKLGYQTGTHNGRMVGYTHGTGHGVGIAIHEEPVRINWTSYVLKPGNAVTIEPGLYYPGIGGVRIEDIAVVTPTGYKIIGNYPKKLEL